MAPDTYSGIIIASVFKRGVAIQPVGHPELPEINSV